MSEWELARVGDVADVFDGPHATPKKTSAGPWFLSISSLSGGRLNLGESAHLSEDDFVKWTRRVTPQEGDVLFSYETRLGEAALMPGGLKACLGRRMGILRPKRDRIDPRFLLYAYIAPRFQQVIKERSIPGATVERIPLTELPQWSIAVPPIREQRAIAAMLGGLDDKIAVNERIAQTARELGLALFRRASDSGSEELPVASLTHALSRGVAPKYTDDESELLVLNQKCVRGGRVTLAAGRRTLAAKVPSVKRLKKHDVLVNSTGVGTLGRVARWTQQIEATVDSHITIVRFDQSKVDQLCGGFAMLVAQPEIERLGEGSTGQTELSRLKLGQVSLRLPDSSVQKTLSGELGALEERGDSALAECHSLAKLRDALLPGLISGEIRVREAEKAVEDAI